MSKKNLKAFARSAQRSCDVCKHYFPLVRHHLNGREIPKYDEPFNVAEVCPNCHQDIHSGEVVVEGWMQTSVGRELIWRNKNSDPVTDRSCTPYLTNC